MSELTSLYTRSATWGVFISDHFCSLRSEQWNLAFQYAFLLLRVHMSIFCMWHFPLCELSLRTVVLLVFLIVHF